MTVQELPWKFDRGWSTAGSWIADCVYRYMIHLPCGTPTFKVIAGGAGSREEVGSFPTLAAAKRGAQKHLEETVASAIAIP